MRYSDTQALPCPDPNDYGAGGRQLQDAAERLETLFNTIDSGYLTRRNPPTWIARRTTGQTLILSIWNDVGWQSVDFDNTGARAPTLSGSIVQGRLGTEGRPEVWWIGAYIEMTVGATLGSRREVRLVVEAFDALTGFVQTQIFLLTGEESSTGGEQRIVDATVRIPANATFKVQVLSFSASAHNVDAGSFCWATRIGQE